ncbi:hypothetical protein IAQ61_008111 [Plenodomus lingam]|uniref:uncharacterized protein n=1 Tax=Leptosphaeria maculans TaxID=5022 RepID=UPI003322B1C1|nr:hypothetical protein IAQ61_008111 [Plenodomus lingam]
MALPNCGAAAVLSCVQGPRCRGSGDNLQYATRRCCARSSQALQTQHSSAGSNSSSSGGSSKQQGPPGEATRTIASQSWSCQGCVNDAHQAVKVCPNPLRAGRRSTCKVEQTMKAFGQARPTCISYEQPPRALADANKELALAA